MLRRHILFLVFAACGDNLKVAPPDAAPEPDAPVLPDATVCEADITTDEANCGACDNLCKGGEVCKSSMCACPVGLVPGVIAPTGLEQFFGAAGFRIALAPTIGLSGINGLAFGYGGSVQLDTDIDLSKVQLGSLPFVGSIAGLNIQNFALDASYVATAGTLRLTKRCDTEIQGTLTNATFKGLKGGLLGGGIPEVDPAGCVVQVSSLTFHLATKPCPEE